MGLLAPYRRLPQMNDMHKPVPANDPQGGGVGNPESTDIATPRTALDEQTVARLTEPPEAPQPANTLVDDDELLAALSEVEALAADLRAEIPDLRDDAAPSSDAPAGRAEAPTTDVEPTVTDDGADAEPAGALVHEPDLPAPAEAESLAEEPAGPVADFGEAELQADPFDGDSLIPDDELAAAFAEVEYVEVAFEEESAPDPEESPELPTDQVPPAGQGRALRFQIGKKPEVAVDAQPMPPEGPTEAKAIAVPVVRLGKRLYRATDAAFELVNRPFGFVGGGARALAGQIAIATIVVSALSAIAIPLVRSDRNAVAFLRERRAAMETANPPRTTPTSPDADSATESAD